MDYAVVGCVELTTQGNNLGWSDAAFEFHAHVDALEQRPRGAVRQGFDLLRLAFGVSHEWDKTADDQQQH